MLNWKCYQVSKPKIEVHMTIFIYVALRICVHNRKDDIFMQRQQIQIFKCSGAKGPKAHSFVQKVYSFNDSQIDEAHTTLDIFRFAVFLPFPW